MATELLNADIAGAIDILRGNGRLFDLVVVNPPRDKSPGQVADSVASLSELISPSGFAAAVIGVRASEPAAATKTMNLLPSATGLELQASMVWVWSAVIDGTRIGKYRPTISKRLVDTTHALIALMSRGGNVPLPQDSTSALFVPYGRELPPTWRADEEPEWIKVSEAAALGASTSRTSDLASEGLIRSNGKTGISRRVCKRSVLRYIKYKDEGLTSFEAGELPRGLYEGLIDVKQPAAVAALGAGGSGVLTAVSRGAVGAGSEAEPEIFARGNRRLEILKS